MLDECRVCVATPFCPIFAGKLDRSTWSWCRGKFKLDKALELSEIPRNYLKANIYNYIVDQDNQTIFESLKKLTDNIIQVVDEGINFILYGTTVGNGKTFSASVLLNQYIYKTCLTQRFDLEHPLGLFVSYPTLINDLRRQWDAGATAPDMDKIKNVPILLLDDIGSGTITPFAVEQTYLLVDYRYTRGLSTIVTTNLKPTDLMKNELLGKRIFSRLKNNCVPIEFKGSERRTVRRER